MSIQGRTAAVLALLFFGGCQPETGCPEGGTACGGDPSGTWSVSNACRDPVFAPPLPGTYFQQPVQMARQPTPTMASSDWCSLLVLGNVMGVPGVKTFTFPHDTLAVTGGEISYMSDGSSQGTYEAVIRTAGSGGIDLSAACLSRTGLSLSCDVVASALTEFAATRPQDPGVPCADTPNQPASCQFYFSYENIRCAPSAGGGCRCNYGVAFAGAFRGRWLAGGGVLTHSDASRMLPSRADYCVQGSGSSMILWGHERAPILDQAGVRTLELRKAP